MDKVTVIIFGIVQFALFVLIVCGVLGPVFGLVLMACVAWGVSGSGSGAKPPATLYQSSSSPVLDTLALTGMLSLLGDDDDHHHDFDGDDDSGSWDD